MPGFDPDLAERSYGLMRWVNRVLGGIRMVKRFIGAEALNPPQGRPLRVLDLGSGSADIPLAVSHWALRHGLNVQFTCLEINDQAAKMAYKAVQKAIDPRVRVVAADAFEYQPEEPFDCATGSMFFHHLADDRILTLLEHLRGFVYRSVLINDLRRTWPHYIGAMLLTSGMPSELRHDALLSIRRGFRPLELQQLLEQLPNASILVETGWLFRVSAVIRYIRGETP